MQTLSVAQAKVASVVNSMSAQKPVEALAQCGVREELLSQPLTLVPEGPYKLEAGRAGGVGFIAKGGRPPYAAVVATASRDVSVRPIDFSGAFVAEAATGTSGKYPILVRDAGKAKRRLFRWEFVRFVQNVTGFGSAQPDHRPTPLPKRYGDAGRSLRSCRGREETAARRVPEAGLANWYLG